MRLYPCGSHGQPILDPACVCVHSLGCVETDSVSSNRRVDPNKIEPFELWNPRG
jgi:hypothetical protein